MIPTDLFKRYFCIFNLFFVVTASYLSASIINTKIRARIDTPPKVDLVALKTVTPQQAVNIEDYNAILQRNVFNSASVLSAFLEKKKGDVPVNTEYDLIGTVAWNPDRSLALIQSKSGGKVKIYKIGEQLETGGKIVNIQRREVTIERGGKTEVLRLPEFDLAANAIPER